jgi:hypothetical protein
MIMADFQRLVAAIGGFEAVIHNNQTNIGAEMKTIQEKMDDGKKEMRAQVGSLVSRIDANQEQKKEEIRVVKWK